MTEIERKRTPVLVPAVLSVIALITLASVTFFISDGENGSAVPVLGSLVLFADALAILGVYRLNSMRSATVLWCGFGANLGLGVATVFSLFGISMLVAIAFLTYAIWETRRIHQPLFTWPGVLGQTVAFFGFSLLVFLPLELI
jgi:hypothetical protein